jgi:PKD repeat protein
VYDLEVRLAGTFTVVLTLPDVALDANLVYTVFAMGFAAGGPPPLQAVAAIYTMGPNPVYTYAAPGNYTVMMTVTNGCGQDYATYDITVVDCLPPSGADFAWAPMMPFPGQMVHFTGTVAEGSEPLAYAWDFGDGAMGNGANPTHMYAMTGTYTVLMTVTNDCGEDYATYDITVIEGCLEPGGVDYTYMPMAPEVGEMVYFTATVAAGTEPFAYAWDFGDGGTGMGMNVTHTFATTGTFTVTLTVTNPCGMDEMAYAIVVTAPPVETYEIYLPIIVRPLVP